MSEYHDPPLRLTIEAMRWMGDGFEPLGKSAVFDLFSTDGGEAAEILRLLRQVAARRAAATLEGLSLIFDGLDFDAPNAPTEDDLSSLADRGEKLSDLLRVLEQLSPEVVPDEDDEDDEP